MGEGGGRKGGGVGIMVGFVHTKLEVVTGGRDGKVLHVPGNTSLELGQNDAELSPICTKQVSARR